MNFFVKKETSNPLNRGEVVRKSQAALSMFRSAVQQLKDASSDAVKIHDINSSKIRELSDENSMLKTITEDNTKVIDNISALIGESKKPESED